MCKTSHLLAFAASPGAQLQLWTNPQGLSQPHRSTQGQLCQHPPRELWSHTQMRCQLLPDPAEAQGFSSRWWHGAGGLLGSAAQAGAGAVQAVHGVLVTGEGSEVLASVPWNYSGNIL